MLRAIAAATGESKSTVSRELARVPNGTPATVTGTDGKTYAPLTVRRPRLSGRDSRVVRPMDVRFVVRPAEPVLVRPAIRLLPGGDSGTEQPELDPCPQPMDEDQQQSYDDGPPVPEVDQPQGVAAVPTPESTKAPTRADRGAALVFARPRTALGKVKTPGLATHLANIWPVFSNKVLPSLPYVLSTITDPGDQRSYLGSFSQMERECHQIVEAMKTAWGTDSNS